MVMAPVISRAPAPAFSDAQFAAGTAVREQAVRDRRAPAEPGAAPDLKSVLAQWQSLLKTSVAIAAHLEASTGSAPDAPGRMQAAEVRRHVTAMQKALNDPAAGMEEILPLLERGLARIEAARQFLEQPAARRNTLAVSERPARDATYGRVFQFEVPAGAPVEIAYRRVMPDGAHYQGKFEPQKGPGQIWDPKAGSCVLRRSGVRDAYTLGLYRYFNGALDITAGAESFSTDPKPAAPGAAAARIAAIDQAQLLEGLAAWKAHYNASHQRNSPAAEPELAHAAAQPVEAPAAAPARQIKLPPQDTRLFRGQFVKMTVPAGEALFVVTPDGKRLEVAEQSRREAGPYPYLERGQGAAAVFAYPSHARLMSGTYRIETSRPEFRSSIVV